MEVAVANYKFLKALRPLKKVTVDETGRLCYDRRWVQSARRYWNGDSKEQLLEIIETTFNTLHESNPLNNEDEQSVLEHLLDVLKKTYPAYLDLHKLLANLLERSRLVEAHRKAQELLAERTNPPRNDIFEPTAQQHSTTMPPPQNNYANLNDFILELNESASKTRHPIVHDVIVVDDDIDEQVVDSGCCSCFRRKKK